MYVSVAIDLALDRLFTYAVPAEFAEKLQIGQLLRVPFSGRVARGFSMAVSETPPEGVPVAKIRPVQAIEDPSPFFSSALLELVKWIARYTGSPIESCLRAALPASVLKPSAKPRELLYVDVAETPPADAVLTPYQRQLLADVRRLDGGWLQSLAAELKTTAGTLRNLAGKGLLTIAPRAKRRDPLAGRKVLATHPLPLNAEQAAALETVCSAEKPVLLFGVTGSGKTEVYLQAIARELDAGRGAIVLVPEIALTPQTVRRFAGRFGSRVAVLHSALSDGERYDEWHRIRTGEARVAVGPRSAVFAPIRNLGLIVVDEEHDGSYKQDETPRYHARDVAIMRARFEHARVVLGSATPALESWYNVRRGKFQLAEIKNRVAGRSLPVVNLVDMNREMETVGHRPIFSKPLVEAIYRRLANGEQTILFLNRRGYARVWECAGCGWTAACPHCSSEEKALPYTYHRTEACLRCHVCGRWERLPAECPECHGRDFTQTGIGTERAEEALKKIFPQANVIRMDADSTARKQSHDDLLSAFRAHKADILIGTQMIAKGLDFPNVTLVGVLNADVALNLPDFRASERTYQLLAQVSGRAGRAEKPGEVFIQTSQLDAAAIRSAAGNEGYAAFAEGELKGREEGFFPPYCRFATLLVRSQKDALASAWADVYAKTLANFAERNPSLVVSDAFPAALYQVEGWYRYQITLRSPKVSVITAAVRWMREVRPAPATVRVVLDVDALNVL